jgi:hypothetical protein
VRRLIYVFLATVLVSCGATPIANRSASPAAWMSSATATATPALQLDSRQDSITGPGGMTLGQEVGAVMMVGFKGSPSADMLDDWRQHQFGGLFVGDATGTASDVAGLHALIDSFRGVMTHPLLAATDRPGTPVELKTAGFDIELGPVADVGPGQDPAAVARQVTAAITQIHAAGMYAVAEHFLGNGLPAFRAAVAARVDMVMVGDASAPAPSDASRTVQGLRSDLGYSGIAISDDLQALEPSRTSDAAVRFLAAGGDMVMLARGLASADGVYDAIYTAVLSGTYRRSQLDASVQKLLNLGLRFMP